MSPSPKHTRRHGMLNIVSPSSIINLFPSPPSSVSPPSPPPSLTGSCHSSSNSSASVLHTSPSFDDDDHNDFDDTCWFDSDPEDDTLWYARELGQVVSLQNPLPPTLPSQPNSSYKRRYSRKSSVAPLFFPSVKLDPAYSSRRRSIIYSKPLPPPPPLPISPLLCRSAGERPLPRTPLPADVLSLAENQDNDAYECDDEYEYGFCDPFRGNYFSHDNDSDSVYSQDLDLTDFNCDVSFAAITTAATTTAATTTTAAENVQTQHQRFIDDASPFICSPLRSRWSSSTLGSSHVTSATPSSRLRAYLVGGRKGPTNSHTSTSASSSPTVTRQSRKARGSKSPSSFVVGWAPTLLGVRRSGSRASASSSSESGRSNDSVMGDSSGFMFVFFDV